MPTRIGARSYRAPISVIYSLSLVPAVVGGDDIRAVIEVTLRLQRSRCGHDMKLNETHCPWADPIGSSLRT